MPTFAQFPLEGVRHAQYAGSWYESDPDRLKAQLDDFMTAAGKELPAPHAVASDQQPLAIVVPHAGYMFSGQTAAYGFQAARTRPIKRVFLLGPSHHAALHGVALPM